MTSQVLNQEEFDYVHETRFGLWFLASWIWPIHVLRPELKELRALLGPERRRFATVVDLGCGSGYSFALLKRLFGPTRLIGIDVDGGMLALARERTAPAGIAVELRHAPATRLPLGDASVDLVFCHQTLHHIEHQESALAEIRRVLAPGGLLIVSESTRAYIHSWLIRLLFRHPMAVQKTAAEYRALIERAGFVVAEAQVARRVPWWTRADFGLVEKLTGRAPGSDQEPTLINLVAVKG